jgi:hypothetical protein
MLRSAVAAYATAPNLTVQDWRARDYATRWSRLEVVAAIDAHAGSQRDRAEVA